MSALVLEVEYFPMLPRDLPEVAGVEAQIQEFPWSSGNFADSLTAGHSAWIARQGGRLIGFSVVMQVLDEAHLLTIGVAPAMQGQGHGARLLRQAMARATAQGGARMLLEVRPSNTQAVALYRHFGFREIGRRKDYYPAREGREDGLIFDRELP